MQSDLLKKEIITWLQDNNDLEILETLKHIKDQINFNFDEELNDALTIDEFKEKTTAYIKKLPWKK